MAKEESREKLIQMVAAARHSELASLRQTVSGIIRVINDPDASIQDLQDIILVDPPLAAKLLKIANSAYYATLHPVDRIEEAILRIGFESLKEIALSQKLAELFDDKIEFQGFSRNAIWKHSVAVGLLGKMIYRMEFRERGDNVYTAGLLHEIGLISEDQLKNQDLRKVIRMAVDHQVNLFRVEQDVLGFHHAELAAEIMTEWHLPEELCAGLAFHHDPDAAPPAHARLVSVLYAADYLCQVHQIGYCDSPYNHEIIYQRCLKRLNMEPYMLDFIVEDMKSRLRKMEKQGLI